MVRSNNKQQPCMAWQIGTIVPSTMVKNTFSTLNSALGPFGLESGWKELKKLDT